MIPQEVGIALCNMAYRVPDREICGFVSKDWKIFPITNTAENGKQFYMDEGELLEIMQKRWKDLAIVYHSHPGGHPFPSDLDETFSYNRHYRYWIIAGHRIYEWRFTHDGPRCVDESGTEQGEGVATPVFTSPEAI